MEITKTNRQGSSWISDTVRIKYDISVLGNGAVHSITGIILKEDNPAGFFNADDSGVLGFSLDRNSGLSWGERKAIFDALISDTQQAFCGDVHTDSANDSLTGQDLNTYNNEEIPELAIVSE
jgi:hypothetical protein